MKQLFLGLHNVPSHSHLRTAKNVILLMEVSSELQGVGNRVCPLAIEG